MKTIEIKETPTAILGYTTSDVAKYIIAEAKRQQCCVRTKFNDFYLEATPSDSPEAVVEHASALLHRRAERSREIQATEAKLAQLKREQE